jgi:hypothetical protein
LHLTASTALASVLAGLAGGALAYACGLDLATAMLTGLAVFGGGMLLWLGENFSLMRRQQFPHATAQHIVFNGTHVAVSGLLGNLPATIGCTALARQFSSEAPPLPIAVNASGANSAQAAPAPELGGAGFALLLGAIAVPAYAILFFALRVIRSRCTGGTGGINGTGAANHEQAMLADELGKRCISNSRALEFTFAFGIPLIAITASLITPAYALRTLAGSDTGTRFAILYAGNLAGSTVREILNQTTARAWTSIKRNGAGLDYALSQAPPIERPYSTIVPTIISIPLFAASSGLLLAASNSFPALQLVPPQTSILALSARQLAERVCMRQLAIGSTGEMLEALWRYLPLGAYAAVRKIPLEYRRSNGGGLIDSPRQWLRHIGDKASYQKACVFAAARILDGGLVSLLYLLPFGNIGAALVQGATMARTPLLAANILPRLDLAREHALDIMEAGIEDEDTVSTATSTTGSDGAADQRPLESVVAQARRLNESSFLHSYF